MRAVVQRCLSASVQANTTVSGSIGPGMLALIGIERTDTAADAEYVCRKLLSLRLWPTAERGDWQASVVDQRFGVLLVSQFTLYAVTKKGTRPDFHEAMPPDAAREFYAAFVARVRAAYVADKVGDGVFGAKMEVSLVNDGPVTIIVDSADSVRGGGGAGAADVAEALVLTAGERERWSKLPKPVKFKGKPTAEDLLQLKAAKAANVTLVQEVCERTGASAKAVDKAAAAGS